MDTLIKVEKEVLDKIANYLIHRPYVEVYELLNQLSASIVENNKPEKE
jgi:hypothetical protein